MLSKVLHTWDKMPGAGNLQQVKGGGVAKCKCMALGDDGLEFKSYLPNVLALVSKIFILLVFMDIEELIFTLQGCWEC